jgi:hypothetical protein
MYVQIKFIVLENQHQQNVTIVYGKDQKKLSKSATIFIQKGVVIETMKYDK